MLEQDMDSQIELSTTNGALLLADELGLNKQRELIIAEAERHRREEDVKHRVEEASKIYPKITDKEIFDMLKPTIDASKTMCAGCAHEFIDYSHFSVTYSKPEEFETIIPMNGLLALKVAKEKNIFDRIEIAEIRVAKDPILVGIIGKWGRDNMFMIGRWL